MDFSIKHVNNQIDVLDQIAEKMHTKVEADNASEAPTVLAFVGAGPSKAADLPLGAELKMLIRDNFISEEQEETKIHQILEDEIKTHFGSSKAFEKLTLFEFAAVVSKFEYGKKVIKQTINKSLNRATHRPLSYELLAHMSKHRYVDHFIILNFDRLMEQSLDDEHPDRVKVVASPHDIPLKSDRKGNECYAIHPFGILGEGPYSVTLDDVEKFGPDPIREFIEKDLLPHNSQPLILLLIGYRAEEPAFERFLREQQSRYHRDIHIFVIDPDQDACNNLKVLSQVEGSSGKEIVSTIKSVQLESDVALELLFELLRIKWLKSDHHVWITAARHKILSKLFSQKQLECKTTRFKIELLLQGVKSRGFVHLEAFGHVPRLKKYGNEESAAVINNLRARDILTPDFWQDPERKKDRYVPNYMIKDNNLVIQEFLSMKWKGFRGQIKEWRVEEKEGRLLANLEQVEANEFLAREIKKIQRAPEIEVVGNITPEVPWILGGEATELTSIDELTKMTRLMIESALSIKGEEEFKVMGVWSTGEWLFHEDGWAHDLGDELLDRSDLKIEIIVTKPGGVTGDRSYRRDAVGKYVTSTHKAHVELKWINWWELNRIMTLVQCKDGRFRAIYMRRRLSRPLVCPYFIDYQDQNARKYIRELWDIYWECSEKPSSGPMG